MSTRGAPQSLERSQLSWQPPPYLQYFVCNCLQNGRSCRSMSPRPAWSSNNLPSQPPSFFLFTESELPEPLHRRWHWVSPTTDQKIRAAGGPKDNTTCPLCQETFSLTRALIRHVDTHYTQSFCPCGEYEFYPSSVLDHQHKTGCYQGAIFMVDKASFSDFFTAIWSIIYKLLVLAALSHGFPI